MQAFTIIRVSAQDQLHGYGPDIQWEKDVLIGASSLGLEPSKQHRRVIQERATDWNRELFERAVREGLVLYQKGEVEAMLFPRVDRETRFVFGSFPLLAEVVRHGMPVFFARDKLRLDPMNPESVERYFNKAIQAQAYVATMRENTMTAIRMRAEKDHRMPTGGSKWAYHYHHYRRYQVADSNSGRYTLNPQRGTWLCRLKDCVLLEGLSLKKCEKRFEKLTGMRLNRSTLLRILTDPIVIGKVYAYRHKLVVDSNGRKHRVSVPNGEWLLVYEDPSLRIFSDREYYALKSKLELNRQNSSRNTKYHYPPLKGLVICGSCHLKMQALTTNFGTAYYRCQSCRNHINAKQLWCQVKGYLTGLLLDPERLTATIKANFDNGQTMSRLEEELLSLKREKEGWKQSRVRQRRLYLFPSSNYSEQDYLQDDQRILSQLQKVDDRIVEVERGMTEVRQAKLDEEGIKHFCQIAASNLDKMSDSQWQLLLEVMHLKIVIVGKTALVRGRIPVSDSDIMSQPAHR